MKTKIWKLRLLKPYDYGKVGLKTEKLKTELVEYVSKENKALELIGKITIVENNIFKQYQPKTFLN